MKRHPARAATAALLLSIFFSGCTLFGSPAPEPTVRPLSPVREFIISRTPGTPESTGTVSDSEFGENLRIVLEQEFLSATGETCRRASLLSPQGDAEMVVMCRNASGNWKMAPRVWGQGLPPVADRRTVPSAGEPDTSKNGNTFPDSQTAATPQPAPAAQTPDRETAPQPEQRSE